MRRRRGVSAAENPKSVHVSIRLDADMAAAVDGEIERLSKLTPGIVYNRSMVIRMVIAERLQVVLAEQELHAAVRRIDAPSQAADRSLAAQRFS
jgi:hypothetical protein